jgi:hypothetical protein
MMSKTVKAPVSWEEPPSKETRYDWSAIAAQLRERPMEWAKIFECDRTSLATAIRIDGIKALPTSEFDVRTRNNKRGEPRTCTMFLRYNPKKVSK